MRVMKNNSVTTATKDQRGAKRRKQNMMKLKLELYVMLGCADTFAIYTKFPVHFSPARVNRGYERATDY